MSDVYPDDEPGTDAPAWAASRTMPWERVPDQRRGDDGYEERYDAGGGSGGGRGRGADGGRGSGGGPGSGGRRGSGDGPGSDGGPGSGGGRGSGGSTYGRPRRPDDTDDFPRPDPPGEPRRPPRPEGRTYGTPREQRLAREPRREPEWDFAEPAPTRDYPTREPPRRDDYRRREERPRTPPEQSTGREWGRDQIPRRGRSDAPSHDHDQAARSAPPDYDRGPRPADYDRGPRPADYDRAPRSAPSDYGRPAAPPIYQRPARGEHDYGEPDYDRSAPLSGPPDYDRSGRPGPVDFDPAPRSGPPEYESQRPRPTSGGGVYGSARSPDATTGQLPNLADLTIDRLPSGTPFSVSPAGPGYTSAPLTGAGVDGLQATGYMPIVRPGVAGFPAELAAVAATVPDPPEPPPEEKAPDPEQRLATFEFRFDPDTLREQVEGDEVTELEAIRDQLTDKLNGVSDNPTRARLLSLRAVVSRILGDLLKAFADAKLAMAHAEATGELRRIAIAQARLAHVLQWREDFEEADRLFTLANSTELPDRLRATMHQHFGKCAYDQGRYMEACNHFESALDLRKEEDPELIAQTALALDAVFRRVAEKGWGPYPRSREEILQLRKPPSPAFDEDTQRWGFVDANFDFCIGPGYVDVQPFRDSVAWVQRQGSQTWELIDDAGRSLIDPDAGYLGVSSFSDGLAWVTRDGHGQWIAIDKANSVLISTGFDEVRPFRRGIAAVRRGPRWGAVDGVGRIVVQFQFDAFATALSDGRYIDGFSDEGLAIVVLGGLKGVVDRTGRVIVPPMHPVLMIHPVAFLIADEASHWGALDRRGRLIIDQTFSSRMGVLDEIDRLLADTRPVM